MLRFGWLASLVVAGCDLVTGVDFEPSDAPVADAPNGSPLACTQLPPLPSTMMPSGATDTFAAGISILGASAVVVGIKPFVVFEVAEPTQSSVAFATADTLLAPVVPVTGVHVVDAAGPFERAVVWREPNGRLAVAYETAGTIAIATAVGDGLDGKFSSSRTIELPVTGAHIRSVGVGGRRVLVEVENPRSLIELERDPSTETFTALDTLASINELDGAPRHPSLTSDGCRLLFERDPGTLASADRGPDGRFGAATPIPTDAELATWPALSEDGSSLYFSRFSTVRQVFQLFVLQ